MKKILLLLSLVLLSQAAAPAVTPFWSAGSDCSGIPVVYFTPNGAEVTASICATSTEKTCGVTLQIGSANKLESGLFNLTATTPGVYNDPNQVITLPYNISNPPAWDFGGTMLDNKPRLPATERLATFKIKATQYASNSAYALQLNGYSIVGVTTTDCSLPSERPLFASLAMVNLTPEAPPVAIIRQSQTITFATIVASALPSTLNATASSGLPVTFKSSTPTICSVVGNKLTRLLAGTCKVVASQSGDLKWYAAPQVIRSNTQ